MNGPYVAGFCRTCIETYGSAPVVAIDLRSAFLEDYGGLAAILVNREYCQRCGGSLYILTERPDAR